MEFFKPRATVDFMKVRGPLIVISMILNVMGLASAFWPGPNYGIDFKGGTELQLKFTGPVEVGKIRKALADGGYEAEVFNAEGREGHEYMIRVGRVSTLIPEQVTQIKSKLAWNIAGVKIEELKVSPGGDKITLRMRDAVEVAQVDEALKAAGAKVRNSNSFGAPDQHRYEVHLVGVADTVIATLKKELGSVVPDQALRVEWVGPKAGRQLRDAAVRSLLWAMLFIMGYIAIRFDLRFAPGGVVALLHDALITVLVFVILRREVNLATVAALLTILGYSINDTIVVYDRIRENMTRMRGATMHDLINISTTQTLSRTILTSLVTGMSVLPFLYWGTPVIKDFALALLIGITAGTYSSIYIAAPFTEWMDKKLFSKTA
jgi:preprotein translocase subunit SecF